MRQNRKFYIDITLYDDNTRVYFRKATLSQLRAHTYFDIIITDIRTLVSRVQSIQEWGTLFLISLYRCIVKFIR